jgi:hypothetical protein
MLLGKRSRKAIAATLLIILITDTFAPGISYALTSGPTQPEATSFEPVDTTDMVNLQTGDLTYNIPLLEVPGPEGGYPLSLSYHAGIQTNEDASWVGLGWTLNPGAINRSVNGYPDDWYTPSTTRRDFWQGGSTTTYTVGISVGLAETPATANFGLSFSQDTYRGFGVGLDLGVGFQMGGQSSPFNASIGVGLSPYGGGYVNGGLGAGGSFKGFSGSLGFNVSTNFESMNAGFSGGIGYSIKGRGQDHGFSGSLLGASISTGGGKPSYDLGGLTSSVNNANAGKISTSSHGFHIDIPVYYGINLSLGYNKTRYWSDETVNVNTHGSLYPNGWGGTGNQWGSIADGAAYDEYALLEDPAYANIVDNPEAEKVQGGAFPDYDVYSVNAQGLGGNMRPYMFQGGIVHQNMSGGTTSPVTYYSPGPTDNAAFFRFENDFSNSYRQDNAAFYSDASLNLRSVTPPMGTPTYGNNDGNTGFGGGNALAGSKFVNTALQIIPRNRLGYNKNDMMSDGHMIEGYSITNESGVTYHFGLPAYTYNEEDYQEKTDKTVLTFTRQSKPTAYAYTWYLTAITGPDWVDRNNNGTPDDGDWGYWVDFEYGKWTSLYNWRNPSEGFQKDEDNQFQNVSMGTKEVYYLNAIRTRSHLALFEKDVRTDAKSTSSAQFTKNGGNQDYANTSPFDKTSASTLQLSRIYLLNASDEGVVTPGSDPYGYIYKPYSDYNGCTSCALPANVLDSKDVSAAGRASLEAKAIRIIDFNYDYSLCPNTTNSFPFEPVAGTGFGKLTLKSIVTRGKGGATILPPTQFSYELSATDQNMTSGATLGLSTLTTTNGNFQDGDMINAVGNSGSPDFYCGVITSHSFNNGVYTYNLANSSYTTNYNGPITVTVYKTKNPPYGKDAYDMWGMFKSNWSSSMLLFNENVGRQTTPISAKGVDAWSLRSITSPLGGAINIKYEPDQLSTSVMNSDLSFMTTSLGQDGAASYSNTNINFQVNSYGYNTGDIFHVGDVGKILLMARYDNLPGNPTTVTKRSYIFTYTVTGIDNPTTTSGVIHATLNGPIPNNVPYSNFSYLLFGNVAASITNSYGGGIRVKSITTSDNSGFANTISYDYTNPVSGLSSGVTSYLPGILPAYDKNWYATLTTDEGKWYKRGLYQDVSSLYAIARELPPPGVMYEYCTVSKQVQAADEPNARDVPGVTQYQFEVFRPNMVGRVDVPTSSSYTTATGRTSTSTSWGTMITHTLALLKFTGQIGDVKRVVQYDKKDIPTRKKLGETIHHYLDEGLESQPLASFMSQYKTRLAQYYYQGYLQERYSEVKVVNEQGWTPTSQVMSTLSTREQYPSIQTGTTVINYVNGTKTDSYNTGFDFYSGAITQSIETDAYGNNVMTQVIPAYTKYSAMGLKGTYSNNLNMLTQAAGTYRYKVDGVTSGSNKMGLIDATATTWSNGISSLGVDGVAHIQDGRSELSGSTYYPNGNVWRQQANYDWMATGQTSDGLTPMSSFPASADFNWTNPSASDSRWMKSSNITLYDVYSKSLEASDINNNYAATHMNYGESKVVLTGSPAKYYEIAYSGAEDAGLSATNPGFIQAGAGTATTAAAHTGAKSLLLNAGGTKGFIYSISTNNLVAGRNYMASVWVKPVSGTASDVKLYYDINGGTPKTPSFSSGGISAKTAGGWYLVNLMINGTDITAGNTLNVWCRNDHASVNAYVDDMRFQPLNAATTAYVYDPFSGELTHILDNNNLYTRYEYDAAGKLARTYKETVGQNEFKIKEYAYNYGSTLYSSDAISQSYGRTTCSPTQIPTSVFVSVPAGKFTSYISKADANQKAQVYAQDQANMQGTCTQMVVIQLKRQTSASSPMSVAFIQNGTTIDIYSWPGTNTTSSYLLPPGTYTMQFSWGGSGSTTIYYGLDPGGLIWTGGNTTTSSVTFSIGTTYTITGTDMPL